MSFEGKKIKFFTNFASSDIIVASPLGLKMLKDEGKKKKQSQKKSNDESFGFLSSIELLLISKAHVFFMQNFDHLLGVLVKVNIVPHHSECTRDMTKIRPYFFDNLSKFYRQTIIYTDYLFPRLNSLVSKNCLSHNGLLKEKVIYNSTIDDLVGKGVPIELTRLDIESHNVELTQKFNYFTNTIWQKFRGELSYRKKMVIFVSNYFEVVQLRKYFKYV